MKNSILKKYLILVLVYTALCAVVLIGMDKIFNGVVLEFLAGHLSKKQFNWLNGNRELSVCFAYCLGLLFLSIVYMFKLNRLLRLASQSLNEEESRLLGENCPDELREFSQKLKDFRYELKTNEQARLAAEQQKNDLVVYLAHDLKTPLTSIIGYLSLLEEAEDMPIEQRAKYVGIALKKAYRLEQLINEFFEITRLNLQSVPAYKTPVNLTILLAQMIQEFFPMLEERGLEAEQELEAELIIPADADKLARVFDNLFRNAVNYSTPGTKIRCGAWKKEGCVLISIKNSGEHISQEKLEHIFDKFYRSDSARQSATGGAGLGLAIAKQIIEAHDGTIKAFCVDGVTEFRMTLPL